MKKIANLRPKKARPQQAAGNAPASRQPSAEDAYTPLMFFKDGFVNEIFCTMPERTKMLKGWQNAVMREESKLLIGTYIVMVYYAFPMFDDFRSSIESDKELRSNFFAIKGWLDQNNGQQLAEEMRDSYLALRIRGRGE
jgi:hypothetical protein